MKMLLTTMLASAMLLPLTAFGAGPGGPVQAPLQAPGKGMAPMQVPQQAPGKAAQAPHQAPGKMDPSGGYQSFSYQPAPAADYRSFSYQPGAEPAAVAPAAGYQSFSYEPAAAYLGYSDWMPVSTRREARSYRNGVNKALGNVE